MRLEAKVAPTRKYEVIRNIQGDKSQVIDLREKKNQYAYCESEKPTANFFGAGLNSLTSYLDD